LSRTQMAQFLLIKGFSVPADWRSCPFQTDTASSVCSGDALNVLLET
jgi:hypothetical protein